MALSHPGIALNAQLLRLNDGYRSAGIARYIQHLLEALPNAAPEFDFHVFVGEPRAQAVLQGHRVRLTRWPTHSPVGRILWEQAIWPSELARGTYSLVHSLAFVSPLLNRIPSIITVYDLSFILYPEYFRPLNRIYLKWGTRTSVSRARRVIAISESTRRDLVRLLNVPESKIDVVLPGVEPEFFRERNAQAIATFKRVHGLPDHFLFYLGTLEPRKNIPTLIRAFVEARAHYNLPHQLVLAGGRGWKDQEITRALDEAGPFVIRPGFVPQAELPDWYGAADAFIYPSRYEGFGMPVLEAMSAGTPVITSNCSSLPEAAGDAAILIDPGDEDALEAAIGRVLTDQELARDLRQRGPARARTFTWERAAQATAATYRRTLTGLGIETKESH